MALRLSWGYLKVTLGLPQGYLEAAGLLICQCGSRQILHISHKQLFRTNNCTRVCWSQTFDLLPASAILASIYMTFEDEFDGLESLELTNEEWALVDTQVASTLQAFQLESREPRGTSPPVSPRPRRQYYTSTCAQCPEYPYRMQAARATAHGLHRPDLFTAFRPTGSLSVSDLVGPAWCEVKFDYNLRWGRKWERVEQKPEALVTSKGKRIEVRKSDARKGEAIKDAGVVRLFSCRCCWHILTQASMSQAIHKKLERVLQPAEIEIPVSTKEERWGSK